MPAERGPVRWWSAGVVLAGCDGPWLVPTSGAFPTVLANTQEAVGPEGAWPLGSAIYLQVAAACGSQFLGKLGPGGTITQRTIPGVSSSHNIYSLGAHGNLKGPTTGFGAVDMGESS